MTTTPPPVDPLIGQTVSQYEIVAKLGGGGMGVVYKARDIKLGRAVALKFLPPQWSHDESAKQRFVREAQAASATNHRNICVIHNIEETVDGRLFIVMAYYEGETLKQRLERGPLPIADVVEIGSEIAEGLAKAHAQGVVHRDVKPGNLIVTDDGVKILDFGLAKFADALQLTVPGSTIGTVAYMAPEQARGEEADIRSDVWALGIVMFEMLSGSVPFHGSYPEATFHAIKNEPLPSLKTLRPDTPESLERIVMKALEKDPAQRFQTAREPARDLRLLAGRTVPLDLRTEQLPRLASLSRDAMVKKSRLRRLLTPVRTAVAAVLMIAAAATAWYLWTIRPVERTLVAIVPVANHTGNIELDPLRLALTSTLISELSESPNLRVVSYVRLIEMIRPFMTVDRDISSNDAIQAITTESSAPFLVVPTLVYRERDAAWLVQIQIRNAATGTSLANYETTPVTSSLVRQTGLRLAVAAADSVQQHFKLTGPGRSYRARPASARFREADAARWFAEGLAKYDELEYSAALSAFTEAAKLDDQYALTFAWLSRVNVILNRKNEAVAAGQRAKSLLTNDTARFDTAFVSAVLAESQGELDAAEKAYREAIALEPDNPLPRNELADFLKRRQDKNQAAVDAYHDLLRFDPTYVRPHVDLCQLYTRIDDHPLAEKEAQAALERYRARSLKSGESQALLCLGETQREQGGTHLADARRNVERARDLIASLDEPYNLSRAVFYQGSIEYSGGDLRKSATFFEEAAEKTHAVGNRLNEGTTLMNLGVVNFYLGQPTRALNFYQQSRAVFLDLGNERRVAEADLNTIAVQVDYSPDYNDALRRLENARANVEKLGYVDFQLVAMWSQADAYRYSGQLGRARAVLNEALQIARERDLKSKINVLSLALARTEIQDGNYDAARNWLRGLADSDAADDETRIAMGIVLTRMGAFDLARPYLERALTGIESRQLSGLLSSAHAALGELEYETGQAARAHQHFDAAVTSWTDWLPNASSIEALCYRGALKALQGRAAEGREDLSAGVREASKTGRVYLDTLCRTQLARVAVGMKDYAAGSAALKGIPDDSSDRTIGRELRAQVEFWRGRSEEGQGNDAGSRRSDQARQQLAALQASLPTEFRDRFATRSDIAIILQTSPVQSQP